MEPDVTEERHQAHVLLDMLPAEKLDAVRNLLEVMVGSETAAALDHARASLARGEGIPLEEILREFGLT